jgi:hypothetical protein
MSEYILDANDRVFQAMHNCPEYFLAQQTLAVLPTPIAGYIYNLSDLLLPEHPEESALERFKKYSFSGGAIIAVAALNDSSLENETADAVLDLVADKDLPPEMSKNSRSLATLTARKQARRGMHCHGEVAELETVLGKFVSSQSCDSRFKEFAFMGFGFMIAQFDLALIELEIQNTIDREVAELNWDEALNHFTD